MVTCDPGSDAGTGHPPPYVWNERSEQPRVALPWPSGVISRRRTAAGITEPRKLQTIQDPSVFRPALRPRVFLQGKGSPADSDKSWMVVGGKMSHPQEHPCLVTMPASGSNTSVVTKYHSPRDPFLHAVHTVLQPLLPTSHTSSGFTLCFVVQGRGNQQILQESSEVWVTLLVKPSASFWSSTHMG
ncbi:hypothetical protein AV530_005184 [Patagioenas fasciata monilis]|uniref:Uncharacterized protein n=1 Tax=Patagioenas fasciata monilis TaxID=372326 RepID=A0A1V4K4E8_PATFA|nr:hypothetical protein AV530_005184 [Patagioenas fasciata monilis]